MSYSDRHKKAMAYIYQNVEHLEGVKFDLDGLLFYILSIFAEGDPDRALLAFKKGMELYGDPIWKEAADQVRNNM